MKNTMYIVTVCLLGALLALSACYYENPPEPLPIEPDEVSYNTHILPILVQTCALDECHDGTVVPDLSFDKAYNELKKGGYLNAVYPKESILYKSVDYSGGLSMPPSGQLSPLDRELILIWITKGAPFD